MKENELNDDLVELFAKSKLEEAYKAFEGRHGYDPRNHANDHIKYYSYDIEQESQDEDEDTWDFEEIKKPEPTYVIELHYGEVTRHDCPYSVTTYYKLDDVKKEIRELQIGKIL